MNISARIPIRILKEDESSKRLAYLQKKKLTSIVKEIDPSWRGKIVEKTKIRKRMAGFWFFIFISLGWIIAQIIMRMSING